MTQADTSLETLAAEVRAMAVRARAAARETALKTAEEKRRALLAIADALRRSAGDIVRENAKDVQAATQAAKSGAFIDRLTLTTDRVAAMAEGLREIAVLPDPLGEVLREWTRPNGLRIRQVRVPLGVIGMIYESRPNVTAEAAGLCLKSGNAVILRGGTDAFFSNRLLVSLIADALKAHGFPAEAVQLLPPQDRRGITVLTQMTGLVDLIIARGSEEMIHAVTSDARVPVLGHGKGVCHVFVDRAGDPEKAIRIALNAKVQRPGVCNAMETLLVHRDALGAVLPRLGQLYAEAGVEMRADEEAQTHLSNAKPAVPADWDAEYLEKIVAIKAVGDVEEAIAHIHAHGSGHTESIVTEDPVAAARFQAAVDASCVMVNASTRLHDGGVFGFGSEIGISTQKLHARGTMGVRELTTAKYLVNGDGQVRE